jgi:cytochrome c2
MRSGWLLLLAVGACSSKPTPEVGSGSDPQLAPWSDAWINREAKRFAEDLSYRRAALEASLTNHANTYSQQRLGSYALGERGWDALPVWNPRSLPVTAELAAKLERGEMPMVPVDQAPLWNGRSPTTMAEWAALGKRVFFEYPMRSEVFMEWGLQKPELAAAVGVERTRDGGVPGLVVFANVDGQTRVGITCAICHTAVRGGELVVGAARRRFDYGRLRLAYFDDTKAYVDPTLAKQMATWGPGRADVTEDNDADPVAIPDLWGLRDESVLTQAGTIQHASPLALAIRQDTQLTHSNHQRIRPPKQLAWALAMYLYSLAPPPPSTNADLADLLRGAALFATGCRSCHDSPAYSGKAIAANTVGTDPALAFGQARGTGNYRVAPLLDVANAGPYLHQGAVGTLDELFSPARLSPQYRGGPLGPGPIAGHTPGTQLDAADRSALIAFLEIL